MSDIAAVVVAGGRGERAGGGVPKQYRAIGGKPVIRLTIENLRASSAFSAIQPVIHPDDVDRFEESIAGLDVLTPVFGGTTRQLSVLAGLEALQSRRPRLVAVHDAARPFVSPGVIARAIEAGAEGAAVPVLPVTDT